MSHFAKVEDGIVTEVIVAEQDVIDSGLFGDPALWIQTSYNTRHNLHHDHASGEPDGGTPLRANFAGIGYTYDPVNDVFYPPAPFNSWVIDKTSWSWIPPLPRPTDGKFYIWDEPTVSWLETDPPSEETPPA